MSEELYREAILELQVFGEMAAALLASVEELGGDGAGQLGLAVVDLDAIAEPGD